MKYYNLMIQVDQHEGSYLSICKHYRAIYDTPCILEDSSKWQQVRGLSPEAQHAEIRTMAEFFQQQHDIFSKLYLSFQYLACIQALKSVVLYVILSPYDNEQSDLVHRISADKKLEEIPKYK